MGDMSVREFYSAPTRYLAQAVNKESEFEKPYLDDDRGKMHMDLPWPDWPPFPPVSPWPPMPELPSPAPGGNWCILATPFGALDCDGEITFWVMVCGVSEAGDLCNPGQLSRWKVEGDFTTITSDFLGIVVGIDKEAAVQRPDKTAWIKACFTDPSGNICCEEKEVTCTVCPPDVAFTFDDANTPDTIAPGGSISVYVTGGSPPFVWETTSTGYSFARITTLERQNVLTCVSGVCGVDYDAIASLSITDGCEDTVTEKIRNTGGQWSLVESCNEYQGDYYSECYSADGEYFYEVWWWCPNNTPATCHGLTPCSYFFHDAYCGLPCDPDCEAAEGAYNKYQWGCP